jgi:hypothetical protein
MSLQTDDAPGMRMYYDPPLVYGIYALIVFGLAAVVVTLYTLQRKDTSRIEKYALLVSWAIVPPLWFVIEYFFIFLPYGLEGSFKYFDYGQGVAAKLWAAVSALTALMIYKDAAEEKREREERKDPKSTEDGGDTQKTPD